MGTQWTGSWAGGRIYRDGRRNVYVLERMRQNTRYVYRLEARDEEEAERELAVFERDPTGYRTLPTATETRGLVLDAKTVQAVLDWQRSEGQAVEHRYATRLYLRQWAEALAGKDVNTVTVPECERLLDLWKTARKMRIVALKTFCTYYVRRNLLANNPAAKLQVPKSIAARHTDPRHYERIEVELAYRASDSQVQRDVMRLSLTAGLHITEIERFAEGIGRLVRVEGQGEIAGVLWVLHKSGKQHPNALDVRALAAAERVRARKGIPSRPHRHEYAVRVAGRLTQELNVQMQPVQYGALRHSFITWARSKGGRYVRPANYGVTLDEIRDVVGHSSTKTTRGYDGTEIPPMIAVDVRLEHPSDPEVIESVRVPQGAADTAARNPRRRRRDERQ
jgi:site-specific recombinase XerC